MKTIGYFNKKIVELGAQLMDISTMKKAEAKNIQEQLAVYRLCKTYLETNPSEAFIKDQLEKTVQYVDDKMKIFDDSQDWSKIPKPKEAELRKAYIKKWDIEHKKYQIRWLRHLLD